VFGSGSGRQLWPGTKTTLSCIRRPPHCRQFPPAPPTMELVEVVASPKVPPFQGEGGDPSIQQRLRNPVALAQIQSAAYQRLPSDSGSLPTIAFLLALPNLISLGISCPRRSAFRFRRICASVIDPSPRSFRTNLSPASRAGQHTVKALRVSAFAKSFPHLARDCYAYAHFQASGRVNSIRTRAALSELISDNETTPSALT
jgi:hypothetical protein